MLVSACGSDSDSSDAASSAASSAATSSAAASSSAGSPVRADADLVIWTDQKRADALKATAEKFGTDNDIKVAVQVVANEQLQTNFVTANSAKNGPDIVVGAHDWMGNLVQNGAISPINLSTADQANYSPVAVKAVKYNGQVYALPYAMEALGLYANTKLVGSSAPASIEDAIANAKGKATNPLCLQVGQNGDAYHMQPLYSSAGGYLFGTKANGDYNPADIGVGKPGSIAAAKKISELGKSKALKTSITPDNSIATFTSGKCGYLVSGPWALADIKKAKMSYKLSPVPGFKGMKAAQPFAGVQAFYVASNGKNKSFAEDFLLQNVNTPATMKALYDAEARPPAMTSVLNQVSASDADTKAFAAAANKGLPLPATPAMAKIWDPLGKAEAAIVNGADPTKTMTTAGNSIKKAL